MKEENDRVRLDRWLWAARFFKTRSIATKAVNGGKVHLNGGRVKAARMVGQGDRLEISKGTLLFQVSIESVSERRLPAREAQLLYVESEESIKARQEQRDLRRMSNAGHSPPSGKPSKRDRRKIKEFIRKQ